MMHTEGARQVEVKAREIFQKLAFVRAPCWQPRSLFARFGRGACRGGGSGAFTARMVLHLELVDANEGQAGG